METKVPTNDEEAERMLSDGRDKLVANCLVGIYQCRRATGADVLGAFEVALKAHLDAYRRAQQTQDELTDEPASVAAEQPWWAGWYGDVVDKSLAQG